MNTPQELSFPVEWPNTFLNVLKQAGAEISSQEIQAVQEAVKYDVARRMKYSEQGLYVALETFKRLKKQSCPFQTADLLSENQKFLDNFVQVLQQKTPDDKRTNTVIPFRKK